ncbi:DUF805 domain-containing protein [Bradyrhizobium sp.]|uniref:DUF805 domain-containing protein n=1 Tax=Bradyrhizobium sp. TaxID=376 RepID=UPI004037BF82
MDWTWYLFGFKGRINRAKYWLSGLVVLSFMMIFVALVQLALTIDLVAHAMGTAAGHGKASFAIGLDDIYSALDPAAWQALSFAKLPMLLVRTIGLVLLLWIFLATSIKRLHDRDRSAWWMLPFFAAPQLFNHFSDQLPESDFMMIPGAIALVLMLWGFVELYFLRGTKWTNRYGADPLGKEQMRVRSERARLRATTAWSQDSEIEMVPHKSGPPPAMRVKPMA